MNVSELIEFLKKFPPNSPVAYTYESVVCQVEEDVIYLSMDGVVMIGDEYREEFENGSWSAMKEGGFQE